MINSSFKKPVVQDFKKSEIISNGPAYADGQSELLMAIQLMNSDGSAVTLFKPTYEVVSGTGVTASECTTSNANGVSTCVLKAIHSGVKRVKVTNIEIDLEKNLEFIDPPTKKALVGLISAGKKQTSGLYKLSATAGNQEPGALRTSGTYKLWGGVQGESFSK